MCQMNSNEPLFICDFGGDFSTCGIDLIILGQLGQTPKISSLFINWPMKIPTIVTMFFNIHTLIGGSNQAPHTILHNMFTCFTKSATLEG